MLLDNFVLGEEPLVVLKFSKTEILCGPSEKKDGNCDVVAVSRWETLLKGQTCQFLYD
jgi:hypothetical protein